MSVAEQQFGLVSDSTTSSARHLGPKGQLAEILVFLLLIGPSTVLSLLLINQPQSTMGFIPLAVMVVFRNLGLVALILYFLWRNGEPISRIGWRLDGVWREVLLGLALAGPFFLFSGWMGQFFLHAGLSPAPPDAESMLTPHSPAQFTLATLLTVVVAIAEETIFRGYLLLRLSFVSRSVGFAVILSTLIFSMGHGYEGIAGIATVGVMGLIFALIYLWRGSLVAPAIMHFFQDFVTIVVVSALVQGPAVPSQAMAQQHAAPDIQATANFDAGPYAVCTGHRVNPCTTGGRQRSDTSSHQNR